MPSINDAMKRDVPIKVSRVKGEALRRDSAKNNSIRTPKGPKKVVLKINVANSGSGVNDANKKNRLCRAINEKNVAR